MASNKSPLGDGTSGAAGNTPAPMRNMTSGPVQPRGSLRAANSIPKGGPVFKPDPPSDRQGLIGTTADPNQRRPFKLGGGKPGAEEESDDDRPTPVGGFPSVDADDGGTE